jgi:hypothetical protein
MKICTLLEVANGTPGRILEVSFVEDGHRFGLSEDGKRLHAPGELANAASAPSITCPRCGMTSYSENDIREGYCGNCHDWTGRPA